MNVADTAFAAHTAGLSVVPPREDGTKAPIGAWKQYQAARAGQAQLARWYPRSAGVGLVCGKVSGGLEMFEFEGRAVAEGVDRQFRELCDAAGLGDVLTRVMDGYCEQTPSGGWHLLYRVPTPNGSTKLARRPATADELAADPDDKIKTLIEVKGEGGYTIIAPTNGAVHPNGGRWLLLTGGVGSIAEIADDERDELYRIARLCDQMPADGQRARMADDARPPPDSNDRRPGDDYNAAHDIHERTRGLLVKHGWTPVYSAGGVDFMRRPGKNRGISATLGYGGQAGMLYVFSTSTVFDAEQPYSPFGVYAVLEHGGDYKAAARALRGDGYGDQQRDDQWYRQRQTANDQPPKVDPAPDLDEFLGATDAPYDWVINGVIERGDRVIFTGGEGCGKSTLLRQIGIQAASGFHPFTHDPIRPVRVLLVDLENPPRLLRRELRKLRELVGKGYRAGHMRVCAQPAGIDLLRNADVGWLQEHIVAAEPDLLIVGPVYKLASGDPTAEEPAKAVATALDRLRVTHEFALLMESHSPYAAGRSKRPIRPYGASLWSRWPEIGLCLDDTGQLRPWRGARDERAWPPALIRGGDWPWSPIVNWTDELWARIVAELDGRFVAPSQRELAHRLGVNQSSVQRAIADHRDDWDRLVADMGYSGDA